MSEEKVKEWRELSKAELWDFYGYARIKVCDACQEALSDAADRVAELEEALSKSSSHSPPEENPPPSAS